MIDEPPFWIIWNPDHPATPTTRYPRRALAQAAARAMANKIGQGSVFYVLKTQSCHQRQLEMCDFIMSEWGIGAPCPYHHPVSR